MKTFRVRITNTRTKALLLNEKGHGSDELSVYEYYRTLFPLVDHPDTSITVKEIDRHVLYIGKIGVFGMFSCQNRDLK